MTLNLENYYCYQELAQTGYQTIHTDDINDDNIDQHFKGIINILNDGIETEEVQNMKIHVVFPDDELDLYIIQYMYNLMFWTLICTSGQRIMSFHLFFEKIITQKNIATYVNKWFIRKNLKLIELMKINQSIDRAIGKFRDLENYQQYLCNTLTFKDTTDFMQEFPEFNDTVHFNIEGIPFEDIKDKGMEATRTHIKYVTRADRDHCLKYSFLSGEGTNTKQYKDVAINMGTMPNGQGTVFRHPIPHSFINGGLQDIEDVVIDSSIGRIAQILQKQNVGQSGAFSRKLGLNNQDSRLHRDPTYICDSKHFQRETIHNIDYLNAYDMRYYRFTPNGMEYLLDATKDFHLIGKTLLFRSPMTCASASRGHGICYRCYGDLAYINRNINIGQLASELLGAKYTQILLSAKHQLESAIIKMNWTEEFYTLFDVEFDQIMLRPDTDYKKFKLIINADDIVEEDKDDEGDNEDYDTMEELYYITNFDIKYPDGHVINVHTENNDFIYLHNDLVAKMNINEDYEDSIYELDMNKLGDISLFIVNVRNNELSATMKKVKNLINQKKSMKIYNKDSILEEFIGSNLAGGIRINAVHFETLLMNQIRDKEDVIEKPDWSMTNAPCQLITLDNALNDNPSVSVRLQSNRLQRTLNHPSNARLYKSSNMDLFSMVHPQEFMNGPFENDGEEEREIVNPFIFVKGENDN